ncbi:hypothetical protein HDU99_001336 [Rhizoclosmatium hyalinum]|nr:hypothetical protein HDU99_001336 [Rhizoclosmatium hyalinum]
MQLNLIVPALLSAIAAAATDAAAVASDCDRLNAAFPTLGYNSTCCPVNPPSSSIPIMCDRNNNIMALMFDNKTELAGVAFPDLSGMTVLGTVYLNATGNQLTAFSLASSNVTVLYLDDNQITGSLSTLPSKLQLLSIANNNLTNIDTVGQVDALKSLCYLDVSNNQITGAIPASLSTFPYPSQLHLDGNGFSNADNFTINGKPFPVQNRAGISTPSVQASSPATFITRISGASIGAVLSLSAIISSVLLF